MCKKKTEKKVIDFLLSLFLIVQTQKKLENCKNTKTDRYLPFDICIEPLKLIIEIDGRQHFENVLHWKSSSDKNSNDDVYKMRRAIESGYSVYRVVQKDIWKDKYDWKEKLLKIINNAPYDDPNAIYENESGSYNIHIDKLKEYELVFED